MDDQTEWLTLADGERLLATRLTIAGQSSSEARRTLEHWLKKMRVRMMALEVCRWIDDPDSLPLQVGLNFEIERWRHILRQAEYPNAVRENPKPEPNHPIPPLRRETEYNRNIPMDGDVERALGEPAFWSLSEVTSYLTGQLNPDARITYSGIRIAKDDVERMIDLMGLAAEPAPILPNAGQGTARRQSQTITDDQRREGAEPAVLEEAIPAPPLEFTPISESALIRWFADRIKEFDGKRAPTWKHCHTAAKQAFPEKRITKEALLSARRIAAPNWRPGRR